MQKLFPLVIACAVAAGSVACVGTDPDMSAAAKAAEAVRVPVKRSTPADLIATLSAALKARSHKTILALYTTASAAAVNRSIQTGLGTAGSIDDLFLLEMEKPAVNSAIPVEIVENRAPDYRIKLPSGVRLSLRLVSENNGYAIDVIASPGGEILLVSD